MGEPLKNREKTVTNRQFRICENENSECTPEVTKNSIKFLKISKASVQLQLKTFDGRKLKDAGI